MAAFGEFGPFSRWRTGSYRAIGRDYTELGRLCNGPGMKFQEPFSGLTERIALALEGIGPIWPQKPDFVDADPLVFQAETRAFAPINDVNRMKLTRLKGKRSNGRADAAADRAA